MSNSESGHGSDPGRSSSEQICIKSCTLVCGLQPYCEKMHVPRSVKFLNVGGRERRVKLITCYGYQPPNGNRSS